MKNWFQRYFPKPCWQVLFWLLGAHIVHLNAGELFDKLEQELARLIDQARPSVVTIASTIAYVYPASQETSVLPLWGKKSEKQTIKFRNISSGIIFDPAGYIVTRSNVMQDAEEIMVTLSGNRELKATFIGFDEITGLTVIKINAPDLTPVRLGKKTDIHVGKWVAIIGNSMGVAPSISLGLINGIRPENNLIQLSAVINPGNSGSPIFNLDGQVIGLVVARVNSGDVAFGANAGIQLYEGGIAYPIDLIQSVSRRLIANQDKKKPWFGIKTQDAVAQPGTVIITSIMEESPAQKAGLKPNDVILAVNGQPMTSSIDLKNAMEQAEPGREFKLHVKRDEKYFECSVVLGEWPQKTSPGAPPAAVISNLRQINVDEFTPDLNIYQLNAKDIELLRLRIESLENEIKQIKSQIHK